MFTCAAMEEHEEDTQNFSEVGLELRYKHPQRRVNDYLSSGSLTVIRLPVIDGDPDALLEAGLRVDGNTRIYDM